MTNKTSGESKRIWIGGGLVLAVTALSVIFMVFRQKTSLAHETNRRIKELEQGPVVKAIKAGASSSENGEVYIGEARPYQSVTLYAKTSGYMNKIFVDKGDKVKEGQMLATIISPEIDQAYKAALADLENKKKVLKRDQALVQKEYISKEDEEASETAVQVAEAQVQSLHEQMAYKNIVAPFSGTVTARYADPGALVQNATNSQTSALPIVLLSELDKIRIYIYVPQSEASYLSIGYPATVTMTGNADLKIKTNVTRIAGELDPKTRMMLVEFDLPNTDDTIIPGSYVQVHLQTSGSKQLTVPSTAVVLRGKNSFVPVIAADSTVHFKQVTISNNDGINAAIASGIQPGELIGVNVSNSLVDGQKVRVQL